MWLVPVEAEFPFDASTQFEKSLKIGTKTTEDMKISFETEHAEEMFVIGDTPHDIECAHAIGARTIAVATGGYSVEELTEHRPWRVFAELPPVDAFMQLIDR